MPSTDDLLHSVGMQLAPYAPHPPEVVHAAAKTALDAALGSKEAQLVVRNASLNPPLRSLLGAAFRLLRTHPDFWSQLYLQASRVAPLPESHPWAPSIAHVAAQVPPVVDPATATAPASIVTGGRGGGRVRHSRRGHGGAIGRPRRLHPGVADDWAEGGPYGEGAVYIIDEQNQLEDVDSPVDSEPERIAHAGGWTGD